MSILILVINMRILIIGGAGGIGYKTAKQFASEGDMVYLCVHTEKQVERLNQRLKEENIFMHVFKFDILNKEDFILLDKLKYDILWIHASIGIGGSLISMDVDNLRKNYDVNVFGIMELIKKGYYSMSKNNIDGHIFVTGSIAASLPFPFLSCYTSSKASLSMLVRTFNQELKFLKSNISLSLIELGAYHTGFNQVMIDNKEKYLDKDSIFYKKVNNINRLQRNIFRLIESDNIEKLAIKLTRSMKKRDPKTIIRYPYSQVIFTKLYNFFKM